MENLNEMFESSHTFHGGGVKVEQGPGEAEAVYNAFKSYLGVR